MPRVRNAFKLRAADTPLMETSQFLQLYCPLLLDQVERDDLLIPKLIVVRGSPGSGKSSLLRLFETDTLLALHSKRHLPSNQDLIERLGDLGVLSSSGPQILGLYIQCDSTLRDLSQLSSRLPLIQLFNTLLDTRILALFLRSVQRVCKSGCLKLPDDFTLTPLPSEDGPPHIFGEARSVDDLTKLCAQIDRAFATLLNSFPDDPVPDSIQPHSRLFSLKYLATQLTPGSPLASLIPVVMLDDVQELSPDQRSHVRNEFMRRVGVPRWLSVRTQVFGLEELISLEGVDADRDYREIALEELFQRKPSIFRKFASNVIQRRLQHTESMQEVPIGDFKDFLLRPLESVPESDSQKAIEAIAKQGTKLRRATHFQQSIEAWKASEQSFSGLVEIEHELILASRQANKKQPALLPEFEIPEAPDSKTAEAARLFAALHTKHPYFWGFDTLSQLATGNVEQLLAVSAPLVDRMIYRAELDRDKSITARDQEEMITRSSDDYYRSLDEHHRRGTSVRQFIDNLGRFFQEVTLRPNAPIAPGVNGFGLTRDELKDAADLDSTRESSLFRDVLTNAVAGNVLSVRVTKQGQAGSEKIVFYFNRLLCVRFKLPLNYGGWQHLPVELLARMMREAVPLREMVRRGSSESTVFWDDESE